MAPVAADTNRRSKTCVWPFPWNCTWNVGAVRSETAPVWFTKGTFGSDGTTVTPGWSTFRTYPALPVSADAAFDEQRVPAGGRQGQPSGVGTERRVEHDVAERVEQPPDGVEEVPRLNGM